jgi:hypothetical protein
MALICLTALIIPNKITYAYTIKTTIFNTNDKPNLVAKVAMPQPVAKPIVKQLVKPKSKAYNPCSCVSYARWLTGINVGTIKVAKNHPVNSQTPIVGSLVVFGANKKSPAGHLAVVIAVNGDKMTIKESNWHYCHEGQRVIPIKEPDIKGFYIV